MLETRRGMCEVILREKRWGFIHPESFGVEECFKSECRACANCKQRPSQPLPSKIKISLRLPFIGAPIAAFWSRTFQSHSNENLWAYNHRVALLRVAKPSTIRRTSVGGIGSSSSARLWLFTTFLNKNSNPMYEYQKVYTTPNRRCDP